jgi:hypothetical protein
MELFHRPSVPNRSFKSHVTIKTAYPALWQGNSAKRSTASATNSAIAPQNTVYDPRITADFIPSCTRFR